MAITRLIYIMNEVGIIEYSEKKKERKKKKRKVYF